MAWAPFLLGEIFSSDTLALFIPIIAMMIPIVVIMTKHQQRMTEILSGNSQSLEVQALRQEVAELRSVVEQHHLTLTSRTQPTVDQEIQKLQTY